MSYRLRFVNTWYFRIALNSRIKKQISRVQSLEIIYVQGTIFLSCQTVDSIGVHATKDQEALQIDWERPALDKQLIWHF